MNIISSKITKVSGEALVLAGNDIDTDRIIPARFMRCVTFDGLGEYAFYDERFDESGKSKEHPFDLEEYQNATILIVGRNFGCGSSREHAPQALARAGYKALIGISFADIFAGNCVSIGMPAVTVSSEIHAELVEQLRKWSHLRLEIDLEKKKFTFNGRAQPIDIPDAAHHAFINGLWDTTSVLLEIFLLFTKKQKLFPTLSAKKKERRGEKV